MFTATGVSEGDLRAKGRKVVRRAGKQVLLLAAADRIFAIANRCPHEGYPLSEGTEGPGCVLTCNWHNWKFDLASGRALVGRDPVRTYAIEMRDGEIYVDLSELPADIQRQRALDGLVTAMGDNDPPRMAREVARLERAGFNASSALTHVIGALNERLEFGTTHALGAAPDWLALAERAPSDSARLAAMLEPISHLAWDTVGARRYPYPEAAMPWDANAFIAAVEAEKEIDAIAFVRGALRDGVSLDAIYAALGRAALAHYADFGHSAIYTHKTAQLIKRLGLDSALPALLALVRSLVNGTREERLPEFRSYDAALSAWDGKGELPARPEDFIGLSIDAALDRVRQSSGRAPRELYDALLGAAAWNLLHFDTTFDHATDKQIADNVSWLDFTHALTFANAARHICAQQPELWPRALLQLGLFVGRNKGYVNPHNDVGAFAVVDRDRFIAHEMAGLYDHGIVEPIIACHRIKMLCALEDELAAAPTATWADAMCAAMNRYLNTPQKRHHGLRLATQAQDFIAREG
jgi:nitrite reductase/ring-hydroxylating ferredoxin subunit